MTGPWPASAEPIRAPGAPDDRQSCPAHSPARSRESGHTLIEVSIAIVIVAALTVSTLLTLIPLSKQNRLSRETEFALAEVRDALERIQATPFNEVTTEYPPGGQLAIPELDNGQILVSYTDPTADPLIVQLDLSWDTEDQGTIQRSFITVRTE